MIEHFAIVFYSPFFVLKDNYVRVYCFVGMSALAYGSVSSKYSVIIYSG